MSGPEVGNLRAGDGFLSEQYGDAVIDAVNQFAVLGDQRFGERLLDRLAIKLLDGAGGYGRIERRQVGFGERLQALFAGWATQDVKQFFVHDRGVFNDMRIEYAFR